MAVYFDGRKKLCQFSKTFELGRSKFDVTIFERWVDADSTTTARCGCPGSCKIEKSEGLSERSTNNLKGVIESEIGLKGVLNLKGHIEEMLGHEVCWNQCITNTKSFSFTAPKCGRYTLTIYKLVREYEITYSRYKRRLFEPDVWDKKWTRILYESTNTHDALPDIDEYDEICNCPESKQIVYDGRLCFDSGRLSFRVPYRLTAHGFNAKIFDRDISYTLKGELNKRDYILNNGFESTLSMDYIPDVLIFLGDFEGEQIKFRVFKFIESENKPLNRFLFEQNKILRDYKKKPLHMIFRDYKTKPLNTE